MPEKAKAAETPAAASTYVASQTYEVTLNRMVEFPVGSGFLLSPRDHHLMTGAACMEIGDGIASAVPAANPA